MLPVCKCCSKPTTEMAKQIGVGPTLFLMSTKALAWFFLFLTLINIPVLLFYSKGNVNSERSDTGKDVFAYLSLGNIGQSSDSCGLANYASIRKTENLLESASKTNKTALIQSY